MSAVRGESYSTGPDASPATDPPPGGVDSDSTTVFVLLAVVAVAIGLLLRLQLDRVGLWLDEAQSVAIAQRPGGSWGDLYDGLRADGHPPLYYALLHVWMGWFGTSLGALRALSAILGALAVAALGVMGHRLGGRPLAAVTVAVASVSPFLVRYGTEVRMYSLVTLLATGWWLAIRRSERRRPPTTGDLGLVALTVAALALTHYWSFFLFGAWLMGLIVRRDLGSGSTGRRLVIAHVVGGLAFVPWLPAFFHQLANTGTPWAQAPNPASILVTGAADLAGGREEGAALALMILLAMLAAIGFAGRRTGPNRFEIDLSGRAEIRPIAWLGIGPVLVATVVLTLTDTAFASRYLAIVAGFVMVLVGRGVLQLGPIAGPSILVVVVGLGSVGSWNAVNDVRSQGPQVADAIVGAREADPGPDVVVVCPDQLGPATVAALAATAADDGRSATSVADEPLALSYPRLDDAGRVDWVDYADRQGGAEPAAVADRLIERAAGAPIRLVWQDGYRTIESGCSTLRAILAERYAPARDLVIADPEVFEPMWLTSFDPAP